jgi:hypothetical protein
VSAFSDYLENALLTATLRGGSYTGAAVYITLFTSNPTDANTGAEAAWTGYARQQAHASVISDGFTVPSNGTCSNTKVISFPAVVGAGATVTHWGIMSAASGGELLYHAPLNSAKTLADTDVASFPVGSLVVTLQ